MLSSGVDSRSASSDSSPSRVCTFSMRLAVLVTLDGAPARLVEARAQLGVVALLRGRAGHALPLGARLLDFVERVFAAQRLDALADRDERRAARGGALRFGQPLGLRAPALLDRGPRASPASRELVGHRDDFLGPGGRRPLRGQRTPLLGSLVELRSASDVPGAPAIASSRAITRPTRFCHSSCAGRSGRLGLVDRLHQDSGALGDRLVLGARGDAVEELATLDVGGRRFGGALEGGDAGVLVVRLGRDGDELGRIRHAR